MGNYLHTFVLEKKPATHRGRPVEAIRTHPLQRIGTCRNRLGPCQRQVAAARSSDSIGYNDIIGYVQSEIDAQIVAALKSAIEYDCVSMLGEMTEVRGQTTRRDCNF